MVAVAAPIEPACRRDGAIGRGENLIRSDQDTVFTNLLIASNPRRSVVVVLFGDFDLDNGGLRVDRGEPTPFLPPMQYSHPPYSKSKFLAV